MNTELALLCVTAASIGFFHTLAGPDHYLPFIVMSRARRWSLAKTSLITFLCGIGHVLGSVVIGVLGIVLLKVGVSRLEALEAVRGNIAAWLLIGFGLAYLVWGIHSAIRNRPHTHLHSHSGEDTHSHSHTHGDVHAHVHGEEKKNITPWILFTIFVFGPCEPLIPILMYPAYNNSIWGLALVATVFSVVTVATMLCVVMLSSWGVSFARLGKAEKPG